MIKYIYIKQVKSCIRASKTNKLLMKSIGIKRMNKSVLVKNNKYTRGIILKIQHLVVIHIVG